MPLFYQNPTISGYKKPTKITTEELAVRLNFQWTDCLLDGVTKQPISSSQADKQPNLLIKFMGEPYGHGLFAMEPINRGQFILCYTGLKTKTPMKNGLYSINSEPCSAEKYSQGEYPALIDSYSFGNAGRFIQSLPKPEDLRAYQLSSDLISSIASANTYFTFQKKSTVSTPHLIASRKIKAYEIIGFDYGSGFWLQANIEPSLFTEDGRVIKPSQYKVNIFWIQVAAQHDPSWVIRLELTRKKINELCENREIIFGEEGDLVVPSRKILEAMQSGKRYLNLIGTTPVLKIESSNSQEKKKNKEFYKQLDTQSDLFFQSDPDTDPNKRVLLFDFSKQRQRSDRDWQISPTKIDLELLDFAEQAENIILRQNPLLDYFLNQGKNRLDGQREEFYFRKAIHPSNFR